MNWSKLEQCRSAASVVKLNVGTDSNSTGASVRRAQSRPVEALQRFSSRIPASSSNPRRIRKLQQHPLLAARRVVHRVSTHPFEWRRVDMQRHEVGVARLQVRDLMQIIVLRAAYVTFDQIARTNR